MKKNIILLIAFVCWHQITHAQNVGIGTTTPLTKLEVLTNDNSYGIVHTNGTVRLGTYIGNSGGWIGTQSNHPLYFFTNNSSAMMTLRTNGYVGIGTTTPVYSLDIYNAGNAQFFLTEGIGGQTALFSRYTNRLEIQPSDAFEISVNGIDQRNLCIANNGYVGIKNSTPNNQLEIGVAPGFSGNNLAMGNGTQAMSFYQSSTISNWFSNTGFALMPNGGKGYVGIGVSNPANKLQIGSVGSSNYGGNDIAFGNGTQASGIAQTGSLAQWYSTTDIAFMPRGNGHGRVGINTITPGASLEVDDYVVGNTEDYWYFYVASICNACSPGLQRGTITPNVSILASNNIAAVEFDAYSDARIKDIEDVSNSSSDLETLNKIQVTDYTLKDKIKNGNKPFKKVIAQQVETVYPQVVSKHTDFIPNVYKATNKIIKTDSSWILVFDSAHHISKNSTAIKVLTPGNTAMIRATIVSIPSDNKVEIKSDELQGDMIFVYGEEVNDFRTVDYDGLTTLNISATQELSKLVKQQQAEIDAQNIKISALDTEIKKLEAKQ